MKKNIAGKNTETAASASTPIIWPRKTLLMVPNSDCKMLLSIIGARKTRNVLQRGGALDTALPYWLAQPIPRSVVSEFEVSENLWCRSHRRRFGAIAEGELDDVVADIAGPAGNEFGKTSSVVRE